MAKREEKPARKVQGDDNWGGYVRQRLSKDLRKRNANDTTIELTDLAFSEDLTDFQVEDLQALVSLAILLRIFIDFS